MIRLTERLERYRTELAGVDAYLSRNNVCSPDAIVRRCAWLPHSLPSNAHSVPVQVSMEVRKRVKRHLTRSHQNEGGEKAVLDSLPRAIQKELMQDIHMRTLRRTPTFFGFEMAAITQVCAVLQRVLVLPQEVLCEQGDVVNEMYFLEDGCILYSRFALDDDDDDSQDEEDAAPPSDRVEVVGVDAESEDAVGRNERATAPSPRVPTDERAAVTGGTNGDSAVAASEAMSTRLLQNTGTPMCELAFLFGLRQEATLDAVKTSKCCMLPKTDFMALLSDFPDMLNIAQRNVVRPADSIRHSAAF
eukprot:3008239-Prymnesium_polylepis.1